MIQQDGRQGSQREPFVIFTPDEGMREPENKK
jgi:hypothetical protein